MLDEISTNLLVALCIPTGLVLILFIVYLRAHIVAFRAAWIPERIKQSRPLRLLSAIYLRLATCFMFSAALTISWILWPRPFR